MRTALALLSVLAACGGDDDASIDAGSGDSDGSSTSIDAGSVLPSERCQPLDAASGTVVSVGPSDDFAAAIADAAAGATVVLADGTYNVPAAGLWVGADGVTIRSASGNPSAVVLDANYGNTSGGVLNISGRADVAIAELTIRRARFHAIHATGGPDAATVRPRLYRIVASDPGEQAIKINSNYGYDTDDGEIACSRLELSDAGRTQVMGYTSSGSNCYTGGVDAHRARGWTIRDNSIEGFWCSNGDLSEHGVHFWNGGRDTIVERNVLIDNARGIGFGLGQPSDPRTYNDTPCANTAVAAHYGGVIRNNMIVATRAELFASPNGMDLGVGLESACEAVVAHNSIASTTAPFSSIEWRFDPTTATIVNNLVTHNLRDRGGTATLAGNLENSPVAYFSNLPGYDLHLASGASNALGAGDPSGIPYATTDLDGEMRANPPDIGADEYSP
jgi:hypothetical protein